MDSGIGRSLDRISKLPDSVLSHILSFLPTKYAVGTSILSTRWQYLWASVPNLDFDDSLISENWSELDEDREDELKLSFMNFVDRVLLLSDVTRLQKFHLIRSCDDNFDLVNTWICTAIKRNVVEIYLDYCIEDDVKLPHMLFTSKTLAVLILSDGIMIDTPSSVWLPSLKTLHLLSVKYKNDDVAHNLLSGCPVLEELYIDRSGLDDREILNVLVPTLKLLTIHCLHNILEGEDESDEPRHKLVIDAPKLKKLDLADSFSDDFLVMDLSSLLEANIHVGHTSRRPIQSGRYGGRILKLLSGIANVKSLSVSDLTLSVSSLPESDMVFSSCI